MEFLENVVSKMRKPMVEKPIDITQGIRQEMDRQAVAVSRERTVAPNTFQVFLTPETDAAFVQWGKEALAGEFARDALEYAQEQGYSLVGSVKVELIVAQEGARRTVIKAFTESAPSASPQAPTALPQAPSAPAPSAPSPVVPPAPSAAPAASSANPSPFGPGQPQWKALDTPGLQPAPPAPSPAMDPASAQSPHPQSVTNGPETSLPPDQSQKPLLEVVGGQTYLLVGPRTVVGRGKSADISLGDTSVSHQHFEIVQVGPHYVLHDLGSTNGTYVEGNRVTEATLLDRNILTAGRVKLIFWRQAASPEGSR